MTKSRLEAFSDGVLAIIITIMMLELPSPDGTDWEALKPVIPFMLSYILSFIMIGIYWGNHHHLVHTINHMNSAIIWANLHLLFWLSLVPFATKWMAENNFNSSTVAAYGILLFICSMAYYLLLRVIIAGHEQKEPISFSLQKQSKKGMISAIAYLVSIPVAFLSPAISGLIFIGVAVIWWIPDRNIEKALEEI